MNSGWINVGNTVHYFVTKGTSTRRYLEPRCLSVDRLPGEDDVLYNVANDSGVSVCKSCKQKVTAAQMSTLVYRSPDSATPVTEYIIPVYISTAEGVAVPPEVEVVGSGGEFSGGGASDGWDSGSDAGSDAGGDSGGGGE